jgi:hypothetical protein
MKSSLKLLVVAGSLFAATASHAVTIFSDNFNPQNGGTGVLNFGGFTNWTVSSGTVDLIGNGYFDFFPGNGLFVDLDGSTGNAGILTSSAIAVTPGNYLLSFALGGSQRGDANTVNVGVQTGFASASYALGSASPLTTYSIAFSVGSNTSLNLVFENLGGDNLGAILDNVTLERIDTAPAGVPDAGYTLAFFALGMTALGVLRRRI